MAEISARPVVLAPGREGLRFQDLPESNAVLAAASDWENLRGSGILLGKSKEIIRGSGVLLY
jgi:hypothetical protein